MADLHLVIGGDGLIGGALCKELASRNLEFNATSRRPRARWPFDLLDMKDELPPCSIVYIVAAFTGFAKCEGNTKAWRANVDAPIHIARDRCWNAFIVFMSSEAVEWSSSAYARQKAQAEAYFNVAGGAIIRPAKITSDTVGEFAKFAVDVAEAKQRGVFRWPA